MGFLLKSPFSFINWWLTQAPKQLFLTSRRIINLVNNQLSFTLNLRLFFKPLFGDYTLIGRFVGIVVRTFQVVFGFVFLSVLMVILLATPFLWWILPFLVIEQVGFWAFIILFALAYSAWLYKNQNIPNYRVYEVDIENCTGAFRPIALEYHKKILSNKKGGIKALIHTKQVIHLLKLCELQNPTFIKKLQEAPDISIKNLCEEAYNTAKKHKTRYVETEHLFLAVISAIPKSDIFLNTFGTKYQTLEGSVEWVVSKREDQAKLYIWQEDYEMIFTGGFGKGMLGRITPYLDSLSEDLTQKAKRGDTRELVGRDEEIKKIGEILSGKRENVLIIGEAGSGKTTVVEGIARQIIVGTEFKDIQNKRLVRLDIGLLIAGTKTAGEISEKLNWVMDDVKGSGDIILFIDEIHNLVAGTGESGPEMSAIYTILEPHLAAHKIQFIGATSIQNYRKFIEPNDAFARLFNIVEVPPAGEEATLKILAIESKTLEKQSGVFITYAALEKTVELSKKLIHERVFPDKALLVLNRAISTEGSLTKIIDSKTIERTVSEMTHVPAHAVTEEEAQKLLKIEDEMRKMVIGQDHALKQVAAALKRARAGMRSEERPIASFLFVGTTGVGKTQTARSLAKSYFGDKKAMIRLDMSEYQQIDSINRLLGSPDASSQGILSNEVRSRPFALILLDEFEKAHPNILLAFLQVLDEGRLTDNSGNTLDFTNTIIIATSNVGTRTIQEISQRSGSFEEMREAALSEVRKHFAPELLNRFTGIIVYNPLSMENVRKITLMLLDAVKENAENKNIRVNFKQELINELMKRGYSPEWGARPLARVIENSVESYLAEKMLTKEIKQGDEVELGLEVFN
jgi:ATP-dependent Clp protease ATP-binding subunit ClpC